VSFGNSSDCPDIRDFQGRVGRGFNPYQFCFWSDRLIYIPGMGGINKIGSDPKFLVYLCKKPESAAIDIVDGQYLVAGFQQFYNRINCCQTATEGNSGLSV